MKIAVTGANGHVGVNLCQGLAEHGHEINAMIHNHQNALTGLPVRLIKGDLLTKRTLYPLLDGMDVVYHLAARISISGDPDGMVERINFQGTKNILDVATSCRVKRFIHFSSIHAIKPDPVMDELDEKRPLIDHKGHAYDRSKAAGELAVLEAVKNGLDALILSPTAIIGPLDPEPSLSGKAVINLYKRKIPLLVPGGYDWVDVRDVVASAIRAIEHGRKGEKYLLSGKWVSLKEFSQLIGKIAGHSIPDMVLPTWVAYLGLPFINLYSKFAGTDPLYTSESLKIINEGNRRILHEKAARELNHHPRHLEDTLKDFIGWLKESGHI